MPVTYTKDGQTNIVASSKDVPIGGTVSDFGNAKTNKSFNLSPATTPTVSTNPIANQSTTTLSTGNIDSKITGIKTKQDALSNSGIITDSNTGVATYANGTPVPIPPTIYNGQLTDYGRSIGATLPEPPKPTTDGTTPTGGYYGNVYIAPGGIIPKDESGNPVSLTATKQADDEFRKELERQKAQSDANGVDNLTNIGIAYDNLIKQQEQANKAAAAGTTAYLVGAGRGVVSSDNVMLGQVSYGLQQVGILQSQKMDAITKAKQAIIDGDYKYATALHDQADKIAELQQTEYDKIQTKLNDANQKMLDDQKQAAKDQAIADIYSKGITDVPSILAELKKKGIVDITSKEIADTLTNIVPKGLDDLVKTLRQNGTPKDVISKVLASKTIDEAYAAAGDWGAGGTGIIGEYNFAKANGYTGTFSQYQNEDANRKIKVAAAANAAGLTPALTNTALKLSDDYEARSKDYYGQREAYNRLISSANDPSAAGDLALIFNYMKILDPNSTVREGEFATAQNSGSAFDIIGSKYNKIIKGERLTESQRKDFVDRATKLFIGAKKQQDSVAEEFKTRAAQYGVPSNLVVRDTSATGSNASDVVNSQKQDEDKLHAFITKNPNLAAIIDKKIKDIETSLGHSITATEFLLSYPEYSQ